MKYFSSLLTLCFLLVTHVQCKIPKLPDYVKICKRNSELDQCIIESANSIKTHMVHGIKEMGIGSLEPFEVKRAKYERPSLSIDYFDIVVYNLLSYKVTAAHVDVDNVVFTLTVELPLMNHVGKYKTRGDLGVFKLDGDGAYVGNFTNTNINLKSYGKVIKKNGKDYADFYKTEAKVTVEAYSIQMDNIIRNNAQLSATVNKVLNENSQDLVEDVSRVVYQAVIGGIIKAVFDKFPIEVLIHEK